MKKLNKIPHFKSTEAEAQFWDTHDTTDFIDWSKARKTHLVNLKPSTRTISLRLPDDLLASIKVMANKEDVPYQSLMKILLIEGLKAHRK